MIKLPENTVGPYEFETLNEIYVEEIVKQFTKKSISSEKKFYDIIMLILFRINAKYSFNEDENMYLHSFFDVNKALGEIKETDGEAKHEGLFVYIYIHWHIQG